MSEVHKLDSDVRENILIKSEKLFRSRLYSSVSTNDISKAVGISKKTLYKFFRSKEDILRVMIDSTTTQVNARLDRIYQNHEENFIQRVVECLSYIHEMHKNITPQKLMRDIQRNAPSAWMDVRQHMHRRTSSVAAFFRDGAKREEVRADVDFDTSALIYMSCSANILDDRTLQGISMDRNRLFVVFARLFYTGMFSDKARAALEKTRALPPEEQPTVMSPRLSQTDSGTLSIGDRILLASRNQFFRYGYSKVRMDEIATELGISKKTLYNYYSGKEDLLRSVLKDFACDVDYAHGIVDESNCDSFVRGLRSFVMTLASMMGQITPQFVRDLNRTAPHLWEELFDWRAQAIDKTFTKLMQQGQQIGAIRSEWSASELSQTYRVVVDSAFNPEVLASSNVRATDLYKSLVNAMFIGILRDEPRRDFEKIFSQSSLNSQAESALVQVPKATKTATKTKALAPTSRKSSGGATTKKLQS